MYDLGLYWALLGFVLPMGLLELFINRYTRWIVYYLHNTRASEIPKLAAQLQLRLNKERITIAVWSAGMLILLYLIYRLVKVSNILPAELTFTPVTAFVFFVAAFGYVILSAALLNSLYLFCLSEPQAINRALFTALMADIVASFILSRVVDYYYAVFGFLLGSLVFLYLSSRAVNRVFKRLDFVMYKAV